MQFGVREICDVVFKAKGSGYLNRAKQQYPYVAGQPVLYIDTAKTSTLEGAASTVYATGGRGNARLIAWEGEKTLTFTVEDALLSEVGFAILSGAGLFDAGKAGEKTYVHRTTSQEVFNNTVDLTEALENGEQINDSTPIFVMEIKDGSITEKIDGCTVANGNKGLSLPEGHNGAIVLIDYYVEKTTGVTEMTIDSENFAGYYYVEASTLFRRQSDGKDLPAEIIFPNVKIQSNFTFTMAATGDPSTFTFTMDAMPGYTRFNREKKVLCAIQVINEDATSNSELKVDSTRTEATDEKAYPITSDVVKVDFYSADGNIKIHSVILDKGSTVEYKLDNDNFDGWATSPGGSASGQITATADISLYAVFSAE